MHFDTEISSRVPQWLKSAIEDDARKRAAMGRRITPATVIRETLWQRFAAAEPAPVPAAHDATDGKLA